MFMTALTSSQIDAYNATQSPDKTNSDPKAAQDRFLTMLMAQMNNQDPLNPMDSAQMTTQFAQINTVSGIQQLNKTMASMAAQFTSAQALQGVSLIGRMAMVEGNKPVVENEVAYGGFNLTSKADSVKVDIIGTSGETLGSTTLGATDVGQQFFQVPMKGIDPSKVASFKVTATMNGKAVTSQSIALAPIASVSMQDGALKLTSSNGQSFTLDKVLGYR